jgi:DnaJ-class molecular chaperone
MSDYYQVLGVPPDAESNKIKQAYRDLAFKYHPDRNNEDPDAIEKMKQVNEAYAVLSDMNKRREYDALRQQYGSSAHTQFRQQHSEKDIFSGSDIHKILEEMARSFGFRGYDEIFREFYGKGYRSFQIRRPGFFMGGFFFSGTMGPRLHSKGRIPIGKAPLIQLAQGLIQKLTGLQPASKGRDLTDTIHIDAAFAQKGGPYAYDHLKRKKKLVVTIPPDVRDGLKIRLAGMGEAGKGSGPDGDLYLQVRIKRPLLQRIKKMISR